MNTTFRTFFAATVAAFAGAVCYGWEFQSFHAPVAEVVLSVTDDSGNMVTNADVSIWFKNFTTPEGIEVKGKSDADGHFAAAHRTPSSGVFVYVEKDGFYPSSMSASIRDFPDKKEEFERAFARDRWSEKPARLNITIKRIIEPKRLAFHTVNPKKFPVTGKPFGLDLETLEWCPPYGNGRHEDATLVYEAWQDPDRRLRFTRKLTVTMPNAADGFYIVKLDTTSAFPYGCRADTNAVYRKEGMLFFDRSEERIIDQRLPAGDEYFIFRTRTVTNAEGRIVSAHYGRIGEKPQFVTGLKAAVWFNPDENDTNLEDGWH